MGLGFMDFDDLEEAVFSIIRNDDPYKVYKQVQVKNWSHAFWEFFIILDQTKLPFLSFSLGVLSDEECWGKTYGIKLNRKIVAEKMLKPQNWKGENNPLDNLQRYQFACWCCVEEEIVALFGRLKEEHKMEDGDTDALKKFVRFMSRTTGTNFMADHMMEYWSYVISGHAWELKLEGDHPYVYGLDLKLPTYRLRVEAVEFFWEKIKSLPESELSAQQKDEIFMETVVYSLESSNRGCPEVFEFCLSKIDPNKYPELLKRDFALNGFHSSLILLIDLLCFDEFLRLFDCLKPCDISEDSYGSLLECTIIEGYLGPGNNFYAGEGLFMIIWMDERFDSHRISVLNKEMTVYPTLLNSFVRKKRMGPVWAILNKASPDQIKEFQGSNQADYIRSTLKERRDKNSLNKFLSYGRAAFEGLENPSASLMDVEVEVDLDAAPEAKRPRVR